MIDTIVNYTRFSPTTITEEQYTDVGTTFTLGTHKRAFLGSSFVLTRTQGGAPLTAGVDYELAEKDVFYSQTAYENEDVFTRVNILNATYETGDLFATYDAVLTYATTQAVQQLAVQAIPPGTGMPYFGSGAAPLGWLLCDGAAVSRATYADLFAAISTTWGAGDGSTTFNLPDGRGGVLRGAGTGTVNGRNKVGPAVGAKQEDQMQRITGEFNALQLVAASAGAVTTGAFTFGTTTVANRNSTSGESGNNPGFTFNSANSPNARASATTDGETRPYSIGVQWIIKV